MEMVKLTGLVCAPTPVKACGVVLAILAAEGTDKLQELVGVGLPNAQVVLSLTDKGSMSIRELRICLVTLLNSTRSNLGQTGLFPKGLLGSAIKKAV